MDMEPLKWTTEQPTAIGYYWFNGTLRFLGCINQIVQIIPLTDGRFGILGHNIILPSALIKGEWAGPIEPPEG